MKRADGKPLGRLSGCPECTALGGFVACTPCKKDFRKGWRGLVKSERPQARADVSSTEGDGS